MPLPSDISILTTVLSFYNTVSGAVQVEQPPQFYGGIVADPMGLGKTLSMIGLVACDVRAEDIEPSSLPGVDIEVSSGKTLIIVPAPCEFKPCNT